MIEPGATLPRTDHHIHASHYRDGNPREDMTPEAIASQCAELGLDAIGILEHVNASTRHPLDWFLRLAQDYHGTSMAMDTSLGVELDVLDFRGGLSGPPDLRERARVDYVIGSVHHLDADTTRTPDVIEENHRRLMGMISRGRGIDVVGHPWDMVARSCRTNGRTGCWPELVPHALCRELTDALKQHGKALEINHRTRAIFEDPAYRAIVEMVRDAGAAVAVGSDAHDWDALPCSLPIHRFLAEMAFRPEQIWRPASRHRDEP